jgi:excisionase family DNA binding protein
VKREFVLHVITSAFLPLTPNHPREDFVTIREAAERIGVSPTIVRRLIAEKKLPASQVISNWRR